MCRAPPATGLGLAIVQAVARSHGGNVQVFGRAEGGTIFTVALPVSGGDVLPDTRAEDRDGPSGPLGRLRRYTSTTTGRTIGRRLSRS